MKILIDASAATEHSGGMRTHATELLRAWTDDPRGDELVVIAPRTMQGLDLERGASVHYVDSEGFAGRVRAQQLTAGLIFRREHADRYLSLSPVISPLAPRAASFCVVHDWRHRAESHNFSAAQRLYRRTWDRSVATSARAICVSDKTARETEDLLPSARTVVVRHGGDHPRRWTAADPIADPPVVTFGHHANKRPDLVIRGFAAADLPARTRLIVLGARGEYADELRQLAEIEGIGARVEFPGFVSEEELHRTLATASAAVLFSSDEGFGLPVVEAAFFGVPAIVADDSGLGEIHGDAVLVASPDPAALAGRLRDAADASQDTRPVGAVRTWATVVDEMRQVVGDGAGT